MADHEIIADADREGPLSKCFQYPDTFLGLAQYEEEQQKIKERRRSIRVVTETEVKEN